MTVGVGRVRSLRDKGSCQPRHKSEPPPACFDWRGRTLTPERTFVLLPKEYDIQEDWW
ncbi:hypothetical protein J6590_041507 [Homalodisca vitripennis]|nr:hypothetical protein J6590_041507 [Homalodisca vitripennis]